MAEIQGLLSEQDERRREPMKKQWQSDREEKVKALTEKLEKGIKEVFASEKYKAYLSTMAKFHSYSFSQYQLAHFFCHADFNLFIDSRIGI